MAAKKKIISLLVSRSLRAILTRCVTRFSDSIVDLYLSADSLSLAVCAETLCTTNKVVLAGEVRGTPKKSSCSLGAGRPRLCKKLVMNKLGFIGKPLMFPSMFTQSTDIAQGKMHQEARMKVREIKE